MDKELVKLLEQISSLPDDDLKRMIYQDSKSYRSEAIAFAKVVMAKRGYTSTKKRKASENRRATAPKLKEQPSAPASLQKEGGSLAESNIVVRSVACLRCNTELKYVGTRRLHEEKSMSILGELGEMFKNGAQEFLDVCICQKCGHAELFADGVGEDSRPY